MAYTGVVALSDKRSARGSPGKGRWADWEDGECSDASTSICDGSDSMGTSEGESAQSSGEAVPKLPPGQFASAALGSSPAVAMPQGTQQVMLVPVIMNGMQVFMPMVATQACVSSPMAMMTAEGVPAEDNRTTLMFRNLPKSYTRTQLLRILDEEGFQSSYCFIYVPTDFKSLSGFGYAFVAFHRHEDAARAKAHFQGYAWDEASVQSCDIAWSGPVQGREQHIERYRNSPVMHESVPDEYKPAVFEHGRRMAFPAPTKAIRAPRLRHGIAGAVLGPGAGDN